MGALNGGGRKNEFVVGRCWAGRGCPSLDLRGCHGRRWRVSWTTKMPVGRRGRCARVLWTCEGAHGRCWTCDGAEDVRGGHWGASWMLCGCQGVMGVGRGVDVVGHRWRAGASLSSLSSFGGKWSGLVNVFVRLRSENASASRRQVGCCGSTSRGRWKCSWVKSHAVCESTSVVLLRQYDGIRRRGWGADGDPTRSPCPRPCGGGEGNGFVVPRRNPFGASFFCRSPSLRAALVSFLYSSRKPVEDSPCC